MCCLLFCALSCHTKQESPALDASQKDSAMEEKKASAALKKMIAMKVLVHSGDLILRTGKDYTSELMRRLSQEDQTYSHCGIASWERDTLFVYHALGGEWNPDQKLRRDLFEWFCNPYENRGFGIFRYQINKTQQHQIIAASQDFYRHGAKFDMQFDLATDDRLYCSEFVFKTIRKATNDSIALHTTTINHITFVAIDNLFLNPFCNEIKSVSFGKQ